MFESLFEALFSYRPVVFQQGEFRFDVTTSDTESGFNTNFLLATVQTPEPSALLLLSLPSLSLLNRRRRRAHA